MHKLLMISLPLIAGCSTTPAVQYPGPPQWVASQGYLCSEDGLSSFVGQQAGPTVGAEILQRSGARALRWIPHDGVITMEFRPDRVNVRLDPRNRIESVSCG